MAKRIFGFLLPAMLVFIAGPLYAEISQPLVTTGEAVVINITAEEARSQALQQARRKAIEQVCGVQIQSQSFVHNNVLEDDFIHSLSYGRIVSEKVLKWETSVDRPSPSAPSLLTYRVTLKTQVAIEKGESDPFYKVNVKLNKSLFQAGDEMIIYTKVTKPSYISVLNFAADGSVILLFPNQIRKDNFIAPDKTCQIPSPEDSRDVLKLAVFNLPGHSVDVEHIKVIATREPLDLIGALEVQGHYGVSQTATFAAVEVARLIASIPSKDRAEATVAYKVVAE